MVKQFKRQKQRSFLPNITELERIYLAWLLRKSELLYWNLEFEVLGKSSPI